MNEKSFREKLRRSAVVLVKPRAEFLEWVKSMAIKCQWKLPLEKFYDTQGSSWIIRNPSKLKNYDDFAIYLNNYKKDMLRVEVFAVYGGKDSFPYDLSPESFDKFFTIEVFDELIAIDEIL